ncbi:MAG TPA: CAP domain-containing protein, partial [Limnochordia bacterium]
MVSVQRGRLHWAWAIVIACIVALAVPALGAAQSFTVRYGWKAGWTTWSGGHVLERRSSDGWSGWWRWTTIQRPAPRPEPVVPPREEPPAVNRPQPSPSPGSVQLTADEQYLVAQINAARAAEGKPPLTVDARLVAVARQKAQDMASNGYFDHYSPTYGSPFDMMRAAGISYRWAGENIARASSVEVAHRALMESPGHRANI